MWLNDRYHLLEEIGRGGMGTIYSALDTLLDRKVAVKLIFTQGLGADGSARLLREARSAACLNHPNIVSIYDAGVAGDQPYIVMELVRGETLFQKPPAGLDGCVAVAQQVCAALEHAHTHQIVHRDLKTENILVSAAGLVKLTDFGLARPAASRLTGEQSLAGSVFYLAPEVIMDQEVDGRTDLYALGVILYELCTGRLPFTAEDPLAVISQHLYTSPRAPREHNPQISTELEALILQLLEKSPHSRPATASEVLRRLEQIASAPANRQPAAGASQIVRSTPGAERAPSHPVPAQAGGGVPGDLLFGEWLKQYRKSLGLTQEELSTRSGCSVHALRKIETGERRPSKQLAELIARSLGLPKEEWDTFIRVARGELGMDKLPVSLGSTHHAPPQPPAPRYMNIPRPATLFFGREPEMSAIARLLQDPMCRLLTLVGPGGIGKTRLAVEVASREQHRYKDGVCMVNLASLNSASFLTSAVAEALGFYFQGQGEPDRQLISFLQSKDLLLVLDNFEQLLSGSAFLAELLEQSPAVKILCTSRERLNLQAEWVVEVQGLPLPENTAAGRVEDYSSIAMFVQRARQARADFVLRREDWPIVSRICRILDGMPLGIELAAAWVQMLEPSEILAEIETSLDFLATSLRDVPERQRSLRAAFNHSWSLLTDEQAVMLGRLSIFRGGFDRKAAAEIAGATLPVLLALVSKSLIRRQSADRYDLHEVIRQFASSCFVDDSQAEPVKVRYVEYYLDLVRSYEQDLKGPAQQEAVRCLSEDIDNIRLAWSWAINNNKLEWIEKALPGLGSFYEMGSWLQEGIEQIDLLVRALQAQPITPDTERLMGLAFVRQGLLHFRQGRFDHARSNYYDALSMLWPLDDPKLIVEPLVFMSSILHLDGEFDIGKDLATEGLACAQKIGSQWFEAYALDNLGYIEAIKGGYIQGYEYMMSALDLFRTLGDRYYTGVALNFLTPVLVQLGRFDEVDRNLEESLKLYKEIGDHWGTGSAYRFMGYASLARGRVAEARRWINLSLETFREYVTGWDIASCLVYLGEIEKAAGHMEDAKSYYLESLAQSVDTNTKSLANDAILGLAELQALSGFTESAFRLEQYVEKHPSSTASTKERAYILGQSLVEALDEDSRQAAAAWVAQQTQSSILNLLSVEVT